MKHLFACLLFTLVFTASSCGPRVYTAPNAAASTASHSVIAIIPPAVSIAGRPKDDPEHLRRAAEADVYAYQQDMYSWMLRRKQQGRLLGVDVLDPQTTNAILERAGYGPDRRALTPSELAELLEVDAVITSTFNTFKPMSEGAALAIGILFDTWNPTRETTVNLSIYDPYDGMIWNYDWVASGTFTSSAQLVNGLMRNASRRMPYAAK
ncbi:MAG: hypothetical protein AAF840_14440 [Bacteroidota bacterium]